MLRMLAVKLNEMRAQASEVCCTVNRKLPHDVLLLY